MAAFTVFSLCVKPDSVWRTLPVRKVTKSSSSFLCKIRLFTDAIFEKLFFSNLIVVQLYLKAISRNCPVPNRLRFCFAACRKSNLRTGCHRVPRGDRRATVSFCSCKGEQKPRINECRYCFNRCLLGHSLGVRATHLSALQTTQRAPGAGALPSYFCPLHLINADDFIPSARPLSHALIAPHHVLFFLC